MMIPKISLALLTTLMLIGLPLLGISFEKANILSYLEFPPLTRYVAHAPFDISAFVLISAIDLLMVLGIFWLLRHGRLQSRQPWRRQTLQTFPKWGWLGAGIMIAGWFMAWTRFPWFETLQAHTFCLPWIGYILLVNALCVMRTGRSLMTDTPSRFLLLWPVSATFWWFFEYLNRFVQNWHYVGVDNFSAIEYIFHASLAFATVLPAVLSTHRLVLTFEPFRTGLKELVPLTVLGNKSLAVLILAISAVTLSLMGRFPNYLYPLVWCAPMLVITSQQTLWGRTSIFDSIKQGDWRALIASATAALICGFFWELWNYHSLARWEYSVPFVDRFHIFAMPLLGYGGYLPFGWECLLIGHIVMGHLPLKLSTASYGGAQNWKPSVQ